MLKIRSKLYTCVGPIYEQCPYDPSYEPLQATRTAAFVDGVKACKVRATTKSGCTSTRNRSELSLHFFLIFFPKLLIT